MNQIFRIDLGSSVLWTKGALVRRRQRALCTKVYHTSVCKLLNATREVELSSRPRLPSWIG